jgi:hypothetical protein
MNPFTGDFYRMADELAREMGRIRLGWIVAIERQMNATRAGYYVPPVGMLAISVIERMGGLREYEIAFAGGGYVRFNALAFIDILGARPL